MNAKIALKFIAEYPFNEKYDIYIKYPPQKRTIFVQSPRHLNPITYFLQFPELIFQINVQKINNVYLSLGLKIIGLPCGFPHVDPMGYICLGAKCFQDPNYQTLAKSVVESFWSSSNASASCDAFFQYWKRKGSIEENTRSISHLNLSWETLL